MSRSKFPGRGVLSWAGVIAFGSAGSAQPAHSAEVAAGAASALSPLIVTARKRPEPILEAPQSVTAFDGETLRQLDITTVADVATKVPNLSFAYGNGATAIGDARTIAIRGVSGPNTTALYIDQTPVPGSIDPRLADLDRIEILRGPQGTLYGESSLGGSVKFVSRAPTFSGPALNLSVEAGGVRHGGSANRGMEAAGNTVLVEDRAALRFAAFYDRAAGYLERRYPDPTLPSQQHVVDDQGAQRTYGASVSLLTQPASELDVTTRVIFQQQDDLGFPAAFAPLPAFRPQPTLQRAFDVQPRLTDRWVLPSVEIAYRSAGWRVESSTSYFRRRIHELEDSTVGTAQFLEAIGAPLPSQPYAWTGDRKRTQFSQETRLWLGEDGNLTGVVGAFYSKGKDDFVIQPILGHGLQASGAWPDDLLWASDIRSSQQDVALFGELYYRFRPRFTLTLGLRQYWLDQTYHLLADGFLDGGLTNDAPGKNHESGLSPKIALSYQPSEQTQIYASAAKGFRAGGSGQAVIPQCDASLQEIGLTSERARRYASDTIWSYELVAKTQLAHPQLLVTAAAYHLDWTGIQQSVFLPSCAFIITTNAGAAAVNGGELEVVGQLSPRLGVRLGLGYQDARITRQGASGQLAGSRVYQTPRWTATAAASYRRPLNGSITGFVGADASYIGDSVSNNSGGGLILVRPSYGLANVRVGVDWGASEFALSVRNLTNERPNLGDIGYLGYSQRSSLSPELPEPQVMTLPPMSATIQYRHRF